VRCLQEAGYSNIITRTHANLELTDVSAVGQFFATERPQYVFMAAAKVGGIQANNTQPADFIGQNLAIQTNVIHEAWKASVKRLLFLGSSCIYPRLSQQPIREEYLLTGPLEATNRPYALAKIAGIEMCWAYNRQHGTRFLTAMPTNVYGPGDNYHPENSHVMAGLIRRFHEAKAHDLSRVSIWGTGAPRREFIYSDDLASACCFLMSLPETEFSALTAGERNDGTPPLVNVGVSHDISITELASKIRSIVQYTGDIDFDSTKPDGTPRKLMDSSRIAALGWKPKMNLDEGIANSYADFLRSRR
jgi:GDP-L-fucose synthase